MSTEPKPDDAAAEGSVDTDRSGVPAAFPKPRRIGMLVVIAVVVVALDLMIKAAVVAQIEPGHPVRILDGAVYLVLVRNAGAAFSIATGMTWLLSIVAVAVVIVIIRMARRLRSTGWAWGLGLVLGGALGNLIDRIFRAPGVFQGHVVDYISVASSHGEYWPVFNIADSCIVTGGILLVLLAFLGREPDGTRGGQKSAPSPSETARG